MAFRAAEGRVCGNHFNAKENGTFLHHRQKAHHEEQFWVRLASASVLHR